MRRVQQAHEPGRFGEAPSEQRGGAQVSYCVGGQACGDGGEEAVVRRAVEEGVEGASGDGPFVCGCGRDAAERERARDGAVRTSVPGSVLV